MDRLKIICFLSVIVIMLVINEITKFKPLEKVSCEKKTIDKNKNKNKNKKKCKFVNYNTTWCYWSKQLQPTWEKLEEMANNDDSIEVVDLKCDLKENENLCKEQEIQGFPTLRLFVDDKSIDYKGDRSLDDILNFIESNQST